MVRNDDFSLDAFLDKQTNALQELRKAVATLNQRRLLVEQSEAEVKKLLVDLWNDLPPSAVARVEEFLGESPKPNPVWSPESPKSTPPASPKDRKPEADKGEKPKAVDTVLGYPFFKQVFRSDGEYPQTFEEALERAFGKDWRMKTIRVITPGGRRGEGSYITLDEYLKGENSRGLRLLARTYQALDLFTPDLSGKKSDRAKGAVRNLWYQTKFSENREAIKGKLVEWGVPIE